MASDKTKARNERLASIRFKESLIYDSAQGPAMLPETIKRKQLANIAMHNRRSARAEAKRKAA